MVLQEANKVSDCRCKWLLFINSF